MDYWKDGVWDEIVKPMLNVKDTQVVNISTLSRTNPTMRMMIAKRDRLGRPAYNTLMWQSVCDQCREDKSLYLCKHRAGDVPFWIKYENTIDMIDGDVESAMLEMFGLISIDGGDPFFDQDCIDHFANARETVVPHGVRTRRLFLSIDPAQGSKTSDFSALVCSFEMGMIHVSLLLANTQDRAIGTFVSNNRPFGSIIARLAAHRNTSSSRSSLCAHATHSSPNPAARSMSGRSSRRPDARQITSTRVHISSAPTDAWKRTRARSLLYSARMASNTAPICSRVCAATNCANFFVDTRVGSVSIQPHRARKRDL